MMMMMMMVDEDDAIMMMKLKGNITYMITWYGKMLIIMVFEIIMIMSFLRRLILQGKVLSKTAQLTVFARWKELC